MEMFRHETLARKARYMCRRRVEVEFLVGHVFKDLQPIGSSTWALTPYGPGSVHRWEW